MRLFQNSGVYPSYIPRLRALTRGQTGFAAQRDIFLRDRFGASHLLKPVLDGEPDAFFTNGDDPELQTAWARENGLKDETSLEDILLAQIEHHRAEVFYNLDPMRYGDAFLARLPGCVRRTIAWRAAPSAGGAFLGHDLIVNNFPSLLEGYRAQGVRAEYLFPGHDPEAGTYAANQDRPVDVLFIGGYSRHHQVRARMLEGVAALGARYKVTFHLDVSRATRLAETPLGWVGPLRKLRRPTAIRAATQPPVFGRDMYAQLGRAKIVINGAVDMAGRDRGNMRVWEALGCGAALLSDDGNYPEGMTPGADFAIYTDPAEVPARLEAMLAAPERTAALARKGHEMITSRFSKERQWASFQEICE